MANRPGLLGCYRPLKFLEALLHVSIHARVLGTGPRKAEGLGGSKAFEQGGGRLAIAIPSPAASFNAVSQAPEGEHKSISHIMMAKSSGLA
jgi:hypothetical protein